ncbi:MAG: hypothetical protein HY903_20400 [Deltaproteobacteria bacterium]|nr:hypothetical protein [Deltaproteobacteria bacterium]
MLPGYNHNIRYKNGVFHIQTEDSGVQNPHIITHVFCGGNIVESRKTSYADIVNSERLNEMLVDLMQDQHKSMLKDLISGRMDAKVTERSKNAAALNGPAPLNVEAGAQHRASLFAGGGQPMPATAKARPASPAPTPAAPPPAAARPIAPPAPVLRAPPPRLVPRPQTITVQASPPSPSGGANIFEAPPPAPAQQSVFGAPPAARPGAAPAAGGPASSFFGSAPPAEAIIEADTLRMAFESKNESAVDSIFGEDLISEKSLDEVILSYLAEDMQKE